MTTNVFEHQPKPLRNQTAVQIKNDLAKVTAQHGATIDGLRAHIDSAGARAAISRLKTRKSGRSFEEYLCDKSQAERSTAEKNSTTEKLNALLDTVIDFPLELKTLCDAYDCDSRRRLEAAADNLEAAADNLMIQYDETEGFNAVLRDLCNLASENNRSYLAEFVHDALSVNLDGSRSFNSYDMNAVYPLRFAEECRSRAAFIRQILER